jgi:chaperonin cofactor prefoldin
MKKYTLIALVAISVFSCDMITKDVQSEVDDLKAEIVLLSSQIQQLQSEINTLENSQQSDKASLESQISTLEQSITALTTTVNELAGATDEEITALQTLIVALQAELDALKASLLALEESVEDLESRIQVAEVKIDSLGNQVVELLGEISTGMYEDSDRFIYFRNSEYIDEDSGVDVYIRPDANYYWQKMDKVFIDYDFSCEGGNITWSMSAGYYYTTYVWDGYVYFEDLCRDFHVGEQIKLIVSNDKF